MTDDMNVSNLMHHEVEVPIPESALPEDPKELLSNIPDFNDNFTIEKIIQKILTDDKQYDRKQQHYNDGCLPLPFGLRLLCSFPDRGVARSLPNAAGIPEDEQDQCGGEKRPADKPVAHS